MSGSNASNLGYGNQNPYVTTSPLVNSTNSTYSGNLSSNEIPGTNGLPGLHGISSNVAAANASRGGSRRSRRRRSRKTTRRSKKRHTKKYKKRHTKKRHTKRRGHRGGYSQYQNNYPMTPSYSIGASLNSSNSALANPAPYNVLPNCTNCVDNYNHYTNTGFPSRGH